jgi:hypothetical protein
VYGTDALDAMPSTISAAQSTHQRPPPPSLAAPYQPTLPAALPQRRRHFEDHHRQPLHPRPHRLAPQPPGLPFVPRRSSLPFPSSPRSPPSSSPFGKEGQFIHKGTMLFPARRHRRLFPSWVQRVRRNLQSSRDKHPEQHPVQLHSASRATGSRPPCPSIFRSRCSSVWHLLLQDETAGSTVYMGYPRGGGPLSAPAAGPPTTHCKINLQKVSHFSFRICCHFQPANHHNCTTFHHHLHHDSHPEFAKTPAKTPIHHKTKFAQLAMSKEQEISRQNVQDSICELQE